MGQSLSGSIQDASAIRAVGLDAARLPTWVTRDFAAARNAIDPNVRADRITDLGIIEARIPKDEFEATLAPNERVYFGFGSALSASSEIVVRTPEQAALFNRYIVRSIMGTIDYLTQILYALNQKLSVQSVCLTENNVLFARDDVVDYAAQTRQVTQEQTVTAEQFSNTFVSLFAGGPSWIHANAIPLGDDRFLITLAAGAKIENPQPSINISYEPDKRAEIIPAKALVTSH